MRKVNQTQFVVEAKIGECPACERDAVLYTIPNTCPGREGETVTLCRGCRDSYLYASDEGEYKIEF